MAVKFKWPILGVIVSNKKKSIRENIAQARKELQNKLEVNQI